MFEESIKWFLLIIAGFMSGIGWDSFWKTIDYLIKDWIEKHRVPGQFIELIVDLMHHSKTAVLLMTYAFWMIYPQPLGMFLICFALGMLFVDLPREKQRILDIIGKVLLRGVKEEEVKEVAELIEEIATEEGDRQLAEQLLAEE